MFKSNSNPSTWYSVTSSIKTWKIFRLIFCDEQFSLKMNQQPFSQPSRRFLWFFRKKQFIIIIIIILMIYLVLYYIMFMIKTIVIKTLDLAFLHVWKKNNMVNTLFIRGVKMVYVTSRLYFTLKWKSQSLVANILKLPMDKTWSQKSIWS